MDATADVDDLMRSIAQLKVGGTYWGSRPALPPPPYVLVRVRDREVRTSISNELADGRRALFWLHGEPSSGRAGNGNILSGTCDPWHLLSGASEVIVDADDELALIAAIVGLPIHCTGEGPFRDLDKAGPQAIRDTFTELCLAPFEYRDPFTSEQIDLRQVIEISSFWRDLIDGNRAIDAAVGFAFWKRPTVAPLLWAGSGEVPFTSRVHSIGAGDTVAVWRSRASRAMLAELEAKGSRQLEVEDGFIRSAGLGADCVPPLSIVVDRLGAHFDPAQPSELEGLLEKGDFSAEILGRARHLRELIVASGVSKYGAGAHAAKRRVPGRSHVLVPGQVEDDRSVLSGGGAVRTNLELLRRARECAPDAYILYKPHPDVEAGHRVGAIPDEIVLTIADEIVRDPGISPLIAMVDAVHVNTSLAGFEALLRGKNVTTHGVPFYAGWGLTHDLGSIPSRRTRQRSLDELVAAVLLIYPRYLDPETGLPCPPEVLIRRLSQTTSSPRDGPVVRLRRLQGWLKRRLARTLRR